MKTPAAPHKFTEEQAKAVLEWEPLRVVAERVGLTESQAWYLRLRKPEWAQQLTKRKR